jgi:hypothetical protein
MPDLFGGVRVNSPLGLIVFLVFWIVLCECVHVLITLGRRVPVIGWGVSPFGITLMTLCEPSLLFIWLDVLCPALVSGGLLWIGLFTSLSPVTIPERWPIKLFVLVVGICITSCSNLYHALHDMRHPLWGEARVLRTMQLLRTSYTRIHFTAFGQSYLRKHFDVNPTELLQVLSL